jgi:predicted acylesterase/phospholipase RssA
MALAVALASGAVTAQDLDKRPKIGLALAGGGARGALTSGC